ncbi:hypothetical protein GR7B_00147 [Vibrio phage vB_VcorM_GR7B]|nr:hypothetical protein GR7B_00147 [Vibrio phage vB_VcorM_GR7B]
MNEHEKTPSDRNRLIDISNLKFSTTQVLAIVLTLCTAVYFVEDRFANKAETDADIDAIKQAVVNHIAQQTKLNREIIDTVQWMQFRQDAIEGIKNGESSAPKANASRTNAKASEPPALELPDELALPERLFIDSAGNPIIKPISYPN